MKPAAVLACVVTLVAAAPAANANTRRVDWREQKTLSSGGALKFRVTKVVVAPANWAVTVTVTNASPGAVRWDPKGATPLNPFVPPNQWNGGLALVFPASHKVHSSWESPRYLAGLPSSFARPATPKTLAAGASWTGTFGGSGKLKRGTTYSVGLGTFFPLALEAGGASVVWVTDHSLVF